jgi:hypothetical protein
MQETLQHSDVLSSDVVALCALLARIMRRCIAERDERIMTVLTSSTMVQDKECEVSYEPAA